MIKVEIMRIKFQYPFQDVINYMLDKFQKENENCKILSVSTQYVYAEVFITITYEEK